MTDRYRLGSLIPENDSLFATPYTNPATGITALLCIVLYAGTAVCFDESPTTAAEDAISGSLDVARCIVDSVNENEERYRACLKRKAPEATRLQAQRPPNDPCLPALYRDWEELTLHQGRRLDTGDFDRCRIVIDLAACRLELHGARDDGTYNMIFESVVGVGDPDHPTPQGRYYINHIYCYPDVVYFSAASRKSAALYNGFFAPLQTCDRDGRCTGFQDIGIHGYNAEVLAGTTADVLYTYGRVSKGCIRLPNPCLFKYALVRAVGVGPRKKNERGSYHWLDEPVEVLVLRDQTALIVVTGDGSHAGGTGLQSGLTLTVELEQENLHRKHLDQKIEKPKSVIQPMPDPNNFLFSTEDMLEPSEEEYTGDHE